MATVQIPLEQRLRLSQVPWQSYLAYSNGLGPRHIRVTYDRGEMEIMTLSPRHEHCKKRLARLVEALTAEMEMDLASFGSMTCRREDLARALEPDESYWLQNEPKVRGRDDIDLEVDPPPDLALEVEVSRSTLDRMALYAALKVPEVWRWDGKKFRVSLLSADLNWSFFRHWVFGIGILPARDKGSTEKTRAHPGNSACRAAWW